MFCLCIFSSTFSIGGRTQSSRGLCWRSWATLGAYVGGLGPLSGHMLAVLARSWALCWLFWGLCWLSWAALGAYVVGLGPLLGPMLAVLGADLGLSWRSWGQSGWSWKRSGRKVAQTRAGKRSGKRIKAEKWRELKPARTGAWTLIRIFFIRYIPPPRGRKVAFAS